MVVCDERIEICRLSEAIKGVVRLPRHGQWNAASAGQIDSAEQDEMIGEAFTHS